MASTPIISDTGSAVTTLIYKVNMFIFIDLYQKNFYFKLRLSLTRVECWDAVKSLKKIVQIFYSN